MRKVGVLAVVAAGAAVLAVLLARSATDAGGSERAAPPTAAPAVRPERPPGRRISQVVDDTRLSFRLPRCCWEHGPIRRPPSLSGSRNGNHFVSLNAVGPQGAEAVVFWSGFPDDTKTDPCANLLRRPVGRTPRELVSAMVRTPGIELRDGPAMLGVGGRPAVYVALRVFLDLGCDPGFYFTWRPRGPDGECLGACWLESSKGDDIRVWVVDLGGKLLVIQAQTTDDVGPLGPAVARDIRQIVESVEFGP